MNDEEQSNDDTRFMRLALEGAQRALKEGELPVGSVIVSGDTIIGRGERSRGDNFRLDHAEMRALREALTTRPPSRDDGMVDFTVYTTLEPCTMCFGTILNSFIARVVYALEDPYGGATGLHPSAMPPRHQEKFPSVTGGVLREDARKLFAEFCRTTQIPFWQNRENPLVRICLDIEKEGA